MLLYCPCGETYEVMPDVDMPIPNLCPWCRHDGYVTCNCGEIFIPKRDADICPACHAAGQYMEDK